MRKGLFLIVLSLAYLAGIAQDPVRVEDKIFNFGAKVGLNSAIPVITTFSINGVNAENISYEYNVGLSAALFFRINMDRFFIQPSLSWVQSSGNILFTMPTDDEQATSLDYQMAFNTKTLEVPVLIGYKIIKEGPYGLSFMAGPNFKYNYDTRFTSYLSNFPHEYEKNQPYQINIVCGVGVSIWRFFFDVSYEFGINKTDSNFKDYNSEEATDAKISINRHTNMMSFSLGFLF